MTSLASGAAAQIVHLVDAGDTAIALGSGDVAVLATPRLLALAEAATVSAISSSLEPGQTSVGTRVELDHLAASPVGDEVRVTARLDEVAGRRLRFEVLVERTADRRLMARGTVTRVLVDRERFLAAATG